MKKMFKQVAVLAMATAMTVGAATTAMAAGWKQDAKGWWWQEDNGSYPTSQWKWLDGNKDGVAECYYFDGTGYMMANTTTPDGYSVNGEGQWIENGTVKTQGNAASGGNTATSGAIVGGNELRKNLQPGQTYQVSNGTWERDANGFKFRKADGFYVDPTTAINFKYAYDPYVRGDRWMTDDDNDGTWEVYVFGDNGYLCTDVGINGSGFDSFGMHDANGYSITLNYKGTWSNIGPYEVVRKGDEWHCENGTLPSFSDACWKYTGDYSRDAGAIVSGLDHEINRMVSGSYRNVETKYVN